jgi:hypothetical protein
MCGSETFAMLVSSTSMNVAIVTTSAIDPRVVPAGPARREVGGPLLCWKRRGAHQSLTLGSTDIPARRRSIPGWPGSSLSRTGIRWTTFT